MGSVTDSGVTNTNYGVTNSEGNQSNGIVKLEGGAKIQIKQKKGSSDKLASLKPIVGAKILPTKRHATLKKKPAFMIPSSTEIKPTKTHIPTPYPKTIKPSVPIAPVAPLAAPVAVPVAPVAVKPVTSESVSAKPKTEVKKKRRFTERRVSISVKHVASTRKQRRSVNDRVRGMSIDQIRKTLLEKGILKVKSNPPESMMRSMMRDYLSLHHSG